MALERVNCQPQRRVVLLVFGEDLLQRARRKEREFLILIALLVLKFCPKTFSCTFLAGGLSFQEEKLVCEKLVTVTGSLPPTLTVLKL